MKNGNPVETMELSNGETLEIYDASRQISQDAWLVTLIFRITIDLRKKNFNATDGTTEENIRKSLGDTIIYEIKRERNFIKNQVKDHVLNEVKESFIKTNLKYLSHPSFAVKFALKRYNEKNR